MRATNRRTKLRDPHERQHKRTHRHPECVAMVANAPMPGWTPDSLAEAMGLTDPPAAEPQRDTRRPTTTKPARVCGWVIKPEPTVNGGMLGFFFVRVGKVTDYYRLSLLDADDMGSRWLVEKEQRDGSYADPYTVALPPAGSLTTPVCSCPGWRHNGHCRHGNAVTALLANV